MRGQVHFPDQEGCYAGWFCLIRVSSPQGVPRIAWRVESGALLDLEVAPRQKSYGGLAMPLVPETMREEDVLEASEAVALLGRRWKSQIRRRRHRCHSRRRQHPGDLEGPRTALESARRQTACDPLGRIAGAYQGKYCQGADACAPWPLLEMPLAS